MTDKDRCVAEAQQRTENVRRNMRHFREAGMPAWICHAMVKDPTILEAQPRTGAQPIYYSRKNGLRLADWLVAELRKRGFTVNPTPSEYA